MNSRIRYQLRKIRKQIYAAFMVGCLAIGFVLISPVILFEKFKNYMKEEEPPQ